MNKEAINKARAVYYGLFASLLTFFDNANDLNVIRKTIDVLAQNPLDEKSKLAFSNMQNLLIEGGYDLLKKRRAIQSFLALIRRIFPSQLPFSLKIGMMVNTFRDGQLCVQFQLQT